MSISRFATYALLSASLLAFIPACNSTQEGGHEAAVREADERWYRTKANIALSMSEQRFSTGQLELARQELAESLINDPEYPQLWLLAGRIELENSKLELAYNYLDRAVALDDTLAKPYYYQGIIRQSWQQYDMAQACYQQAYERDADNPAYLMAVAEMMVQQGLIQETITLLDEKTTYFDQNASIRALLAHVYRLSGDYEQARRWFKLASMLAPEDQKLQEELARSYMATGQHREAATVLRSLIDSPYAEGRPDLQRMLAKAYMHNDQVREAHGTYQELAQADRNHVEDWFQYGQLSLRIEEYAQALQAANRLINLVPDDHRGYTLAGMVWNKRGSLTRALTMFDRAVELAPDDTTPLILRGMALQRDERPEAAADAYRKALEIDPDDTRAQRLLANVTEGLR